VLLKAGVGLTVTVTFCVLLQPNAVKVYTYVTVIGAAVVLVSASLIVATAPDAVAGVMPATEALLHEKAVPPMVLVAV
jgi:hypothetical protein